MDNRISRINRINRITRITRITRINRINRICLSEYLLKYLTLMEQFLQGNVPLRQMLNAKPPFMT